MVDAGEVAGEVDKGSRSLGKRDSGDFGVRHDPGQRRVSGCLGAVGGVGLVEDVAYVVAHGLDADDELFANLPVGLAAADQLQDFYFSLGQSIRVSGHPA